MILWRITKRVHAAAPLSGEGSRLFGSRWSHPGVPIASTSSSLALAALEYLVHVDSDLLPIELVSIRIEVTQSIVPITIALSLLPSNWREFPAPDALARLGDDWYHSRRSLLLSVPSVVIPDESNVLVNPKHADFGALKIGQPARFGFDPRLLP